MRQYRRVQISYLIYEIGKKSMVNFVYYKSRNIYCRF